MRIAKQPMETGLAGWGGKIRTSASEICVSLASRRGRAYWESGARSVATFALHDRVGPIGTQFPDAEVRVLPPQPASPVSIASHMSRSKLCGTAAFRRYGFVSVCGIWHGGAIPASCLRGPFFGVSFLVPYCPFGQACYPAAMIHDPIAGRLTSLLTHRGQQRLSPC